MKAEVEVLLGSCCVHRFHPRCDIAQLVQLLPGEPRGRAFGGKPRDNAQHPVMISNIFSIKVRHKGATAWDGLDDTFALECDQRLPHGQLTDANSVGDRVLVDLGARLHLACEYSTANLLRSLLLEAGSDRWSSRPRLRGVFHHHRPCARRGSYWVN